MSEGVTYGYDDHRWQLRHWPADQRHGRERWNQLRLRSQGEYNLVEETRTIGSTVYTTTYAYDAFGLRVYKDLTIGGTTHANYDPDGRLLAESAATGVADREYIWLPLDGQPWALPIALVTDAGPAGPRLHYLHADHLGTPVAMTSAGFAQLEWQATYRPFGEAHAISGSESLALRFPGQLFDPETGFHQNSHRDYDPRLGLYLQPTRSGSKAG